MSDKLKFDLDFLEQEDDSPAKRIRSAEKGRAETEKKVAQGKQKKTWLIWSSIIVGIIIIVAIASDDSSTSSSNINTPTTDTSSADADSVILGDFRCSLYHAGQADSLEPESEIALERAISALERRGEELESRYVDPYNHYMVDLYNSEVEEFNNDKFVLDRRIGVYNRQVREYNDYLEENCDSVR